MDSSSSQISKKNGKTDGNTQNSFSEKIGLYLQICKPRLSMLVIITAAIGYIIVSDKFNFAHFGLFTIATILIVYAANAFNCIIEKDTDALMERTKTRPLATKQISTSSAFVFSSILLISSVIIFGYFTNLPTTILALISFVTYVGIYTPMKRYSPWALIVGAIPGAIPPMMGAVAAKGEFTLESYVLFIILFVWQMPHFIAIALFRFKDYKNAGMPTFAHVVGEQKAKMHMIFYSALLLIITYLPFALGWTGYIYLLACVFMTIGFIAICTLSVKGRVEWSRAVFFASLVYLPITLGVWVMELWIK